MDGVSTMEKKISSTNPSCISLTPLKSTSPGIKSPKNFAESKGIVGLGILAAINGKEGCYCQDQCLRRDAVLTLSPKSFKTNPILNEKNCACLFTNTGKSIDSDADMKKRPDVDEMELCEEYTCVISRGNNQIMKREYFDDAGFSLKRNFVTEGYAKITANSSGLGSASFAVSQCAETEAFQVEDPLSYCFLCSKQLHGLDIFMYRGEKAFCSVECRCKQIAYDEHKENCVSGARKPRHYSPSRCSSTMQVFASIVAA